MSNYQPYMIQKGTVYAIPIIHYKMEMAAQVKIACDHLKPDCIAVELPQNMHKQMLHAATRLPDISVICTYGRSHSPIYFMSEPCDPLFEALRYACENQIDAFCIDLDVDRYPNVYEPIPDPYVIHRLGLQTYYKAYEKMRLSANMPHSLIDQQRETYMAHQLKELSLRYDRILFVCGMSHLSSILKYLENNAFPTFDHAHREIIELFTLTDESCRHALAEYGYLTLNYEIWRQKSSTVILPDRQKIIFQLYKEAAALYTHNYSCSFPGYHLRNIMKFLRNYAVIGGQLMPNLFQIITAAKGCVDHNYAYEVWQLATNYPYRKNIDHLTERNLSIDDIWGRSKNIKFHLREKSDKSCTTPKLRADRSKFRLQSPNPFSICSYPPEDIVIENFAHFLKKKGIHLLTEEGGRTIPFSTSLEDGIDTRETIRHWSEGKIYVKMHGAPPAGIGSVCIIFDDDLPTENNPTYKEQYPWQLTWIGEHAQESDMAFYATSFRENVVGPGISRCKYGGFMMSYPSRRMRDVWRDADYQICHGKSEVLLMAAIDYAVKPAIVYVSTKPPRLVFKSFARRFGKKIIYLPLGQFSPVILNKLRIFHVLDGHDKRNIADQYIF